MKVVLPLSGLVSSSKKKEGRVKTIVLIVFRWSSWKHEEPSCSYKVGLLLFAWIQKNEGRFRQPRDEVLISYCRSATKPLWGLGHTFCFLIRCGSIFIHIYKALHLWWGQRKSGIFLPDSFTDFQHYYEVDYSNLIQSKTIWWEKKPQIFQIHTTAQSQQNIIEVPPLPEGFCPFRVQMLTRKTGVTAFQKRLQPHFLVKLQSVVCNRATEMTNITFVIISARRFIFFFKIM